MWLGLGNVAQRTKGVEKFLGLEYYGEFLWVFRMSEICNSVVIAFWGKS